MGRESRRVGGYLEDLAHHLGRVAAEDLAVPVEVLEVGLVQCVTDELDVHLVQILLREAAQEVGG